MSDLLNYLNEKNEFDTLICYYKYKYIYFLIPTIIYIILNISFGLIRY